MNNGIESLQIAPRNVTQVLVYRHGLDWRILLSTVEPSIAVVSGIQSNYVMTSLNQ